METEPAVASPGLGRLARFRWRKLAGIVVVLLALGFMAALVRSQWAVLQSYRWQLSPAWALASLAGLELAWLFEIATWRTILADVGGRLTCRRAMRVWFLSNILRYLPGNVWQFLGMVELAAEDGAPRMATLASIVLHQVISLAAGVVIAAIYFALAGQGVWIAHLRPFLLLAPLGLLLLQPKVLEWGLNWMLVKLGRQPLRVTLTSAGIFRVWLRYAVVWIGLGLSYAALVRALVPVGWSDVPYLAASWVVSYSIGFLSMLTPSGVGVREAVMVVLLAPIMPESVAVVVAIVARLWMVVGEVIGTGVALAVGRRRPASVQREATP